MRIASRGVSAVASASGLCASVWLAHCSLTTSFDDLTGGSDASVADDSAPEAAAVNDAQSDAGGGDAGSPEGSVPRARYQRTIKIANEIVGSPMPAGLTVRIPLDSLPNDIGSGKILGGAADLRVTAGPRGELDRVIDFAPAGEKPALWISLATPIAPGTVDTYTLTYGGTDPAPPKADPAKVFLFFDDFDGVGLSSSWLKLGAPTVAGGELTLHKGVDEGVTTIASTDTVPPRSVLEIRARVSDPMATIGAAGFYYWLGFQRLGDFDASRPWVVFVSRSVGTIQGEIASAGPDAGACYSPECSVQPRPQVAGARWYRIERDLTRTRFILDGIYMGAIDEPNTDYAVLLRNFSGSSDLVVDWVRARAFRSTPMVTVEPEQIAP